MAPAAFHNDAALLHGARPTTTVLIDELFNPHRDGSREYREALAMLLIRVCRAVPSPELVTIARSADAIHVMSGGMAAELIVAYESSQNTSESRIP